MKRFITILAVLSLTTCVLAGNNDVPKMIKVDIGAYQGNNQKLRAQAYMNPDSTQLIAIGLEAGYTYPNARKLARYPYIYIEYTDSLISTLSKVGEKYKEWSKIAEEHKNGKFTKTIDIEIPFFGLSIYKEGSKNFKIVDADENKFVMNVYDENKRPSLVIKHLYKEKYDVDQVIGLVFLDCDEFDQFIDFLKKENIMRRIKTESIDQLYK